MHHDLQICLLGNFRLCDGDTPIHALYTPRLEVFLAYLLLHPDVPQPRSQVAYLLWPDSTDSQAHTNLRHLLHLLRKFLPRPDSFIEADNHNLRWNACAPYALDVNSFLQAVEESVRLEATGDTERLRQALDAAIGLYKGDLLPDCYANWITPEREHLRHFYLETGNRLVRTLEKSGDYVPAIQLMQKMLQHDPMHEDSYCRLMRLHALNGDRVEALQVYQTLVEILQSEYGISPSPTTQDVYDRYLSFRPLLTSPTLLPDPSPDLLIGRGRQWAQIQAALQNAALGKPSIAVVRGEFGLGKTHLLRELLRWARQKGHTAALAQCSDPQSNLPYAPVIAWLRQCGLPTLSAPMLTEIARLLPEIRIAMPVEVASGPHDEEFQRQRLFTALSRAVLGHRPPQLLMIDDLQFCDVDTLEWLNYLLRYDQNAGLLLVVSFSPEELVREAGRADYIHPFLSSVHRTAAVVEVDLDPLNIKDSAALSAELNGALVTAEQADILYQESRGVPFFLVEMIRAGFLKEALPTPASQTQMDFDANLALPPLIVNVLADRLDRLSEPARNLARLAATLDRPILRRVLRETSALDEETLVDALDELVARRIFVEAGGSAYEFSHPKLRYVVLAVMSTARRRLLERRVEKVLARLSEGETHI